MITKGTKNSRGNRARLRNPEDYKILEMYTTRKYEKFRFLAEWLKYIDSLPKKDGDNLLLQIIAYGLHETTPETLSPEATEYFNREIAPELDRQHKRLNEGKQI